jgi:hypothetical protein
VLCVLDASPKLPSATIINHACLSQISKILLIREKISRLSGAVSLDASIGLILEYGEHERKINAEVRGVKKVELKNLMDPGSLAE